MIYYAIIVAGGSGSRMNAETPKQFLLLNNKPVLMYSIEAYSRSALKPQIIVVLNENYFKYWEELTVKYRFDIPHKLVKGGPERFHSVKNALDEVHAEGIIAIHDAARPLINDDLITRTFVQAEEKGNAVAAIASSDSVRIMQGDKAAMVDRNSVFLIQTPQAFRSGILKKAYQQPYSSEFTDDASVVEKLDVRINIVKGYSSNIKITHPEDIQIAQSFLEKNN